MGFVQDSGFRKGLPAMLLIFAIFAIIVVAGSQNLGFVRIGW